MAKFRNNNGFTLIELITSVFIIAMISSLFVINYRQANSKSLLKLEVQKVSSNVRLMQNNALGTVKHNGQVPAEGWGLSFSHNILENDYYILFIDDVKDSNFKYETQYKKINLPEDIIIKEIKIAGSFEIDGKAEIIFLPPDPEVYIDNDNNTNIQITFEDTKNNTSKILEINFLGLVDIVN